MLYRSMSIIMLVVLVLVAGCAKQDTAVATGTPSFDPSEFFPTDVGAKWTYKVTLNQKQDAYNHEATYWPTGDGHVQTVISFGRYMETSKEGRLVLSVDSQTSAQGPLKYPEGVKLKIEQDDFGIFNRVKDLYWAISRSDGYTAILIKTYPAGSNSLANNRWGGLGPDGYSMRLIMITEPPDIAVQMALSENHPKDVLTCVSVEKNSIHFKRTMEGKVEDGELVESEVSKPFTEDTWYKKGVGLNKLVQKVGDEVSMQWDLIDYQPGTK